MTAVSHARILEGEALIGEVRRLRRAEPPDGIALNQALARLIEVVQGDLLARARQLSEPGIDAEELYAESLSQLLTYVLSEGYVSLEQGLGRHLRTMPLTMRDRLRRQRGIPGRPRRAPVQPVDPDEGASGAGTRVQVVSLYDVDGEDGLARHERIEDPDAERAFDGLFADADAAELEAVLGELPPDELRVVRWLAEGLKQTDMAQRLGWSNAKVSRVLARARERLLLLLASRRE